MRLLLYRRPAEYLKEERDVTIEKLNSVKRDLQNLLQKTGIPEIERRYYDDTIILT